MTRFAILLPRVAGTRLRRGVRLATPMVLAALLLPGASTCGGRVSDGDEPSNATPNGNSNPSGPTGTRELPNGNGEYPNRPNEVAPRCDPSSPFATPVPVGGLAVELDAGVPVSDAAPYRPSLSPDELTVYFSGGGIPQDGSIFTAHRSSTDAAFSGIERLDLPPYSFDPTVSSDGLAIYFSLLDTAAHVGRLRIATRGSVAEPFQHVSVPPGLKDESAQTAQTFHEPFLSADGKSLLYRKNGDIFRRRWAGSAWGAEEPFGGFPSFYASYAPVVSRDGRTIYASTVEASHIRTMRVAHRATAYGPFDPPIAMPGANFSNRDPRHFLSNGDAGWLSDDGCRFYFSARQTIDGGSGSYVELGIYVAHHVDE
jgi:hypothetical protein